MKSAIRSSRWCVWSSCACALLLVAGCDAFADPAGDSGPDATAPAQVPTTGTAGAAAPAFFDNATPIAREANATPATAGPQAVPAPPPFGFGGAPAMDGDFFNAELPLSDGHLDGAMPGVALDSDAIVQTAWADGWRDPGFTHRALTFELHAEGEPGAGMMMATLTDISAVSALLRGPDDGSEAPAVPPTSASMSQVEVTGCSGAALYEYDWDQFTQDGEATIELDADDPDTVHVRASATFDDGEQQAHVEGRVSFSRSALLPLLDELEAL